MLTLISISLSFTKSQWLSFSTKRTNTERHEYSSRDSGGPFSYSLHIRLFWCPNNVVFSPCFTPSFSAWPSFSNDFNMPSVTPSASLPLKSRNVKPPQETDNSACTYTPSWVIKLNQINFFFPADFIFCTFRAHFVQLERTFTLVSRLSESHT